MICHLSVIIDSAETAHTIALMSSSSPSLASLGATLRVDSALPLASGPIVNRESRGRHAHACTQCRIAKCKCIVALGAQSCQRCQQRKTTCSYNQMVRSRVGTAGAARSVTSQNQKQTLEDRVDDLSQRLIELETLILRGTHVTCFSPQKSPPGLIAILPRAQSNTAPDMAKLMQTVCGVFPLHTTADDAPQQESLPVMGSLDPRQNVVKQGLITNEVAHELMD